MSTALRCLALVTFVFSLASAGRAEQPQDSPSENSNSAAQHWKLAARLSAMGDHEKAIAECDLALEAEPEYLPVLDLRGSENFRLGRFAESVKDFDRAIAIEPRLGREHWKRGISCYYAGHFTEGRKQFESYQTFDDNDVENAVWRFLCISRQDGLEAARADMLRIRRDTRVPMMEVYELYAGRLEPTDVLAAATAGEPAEHERKQRLFYAHLYLGLYYDLVGRRDEARRYVDRAATEFRIDHYMGDVAKVHAQLLKDQPTK